MQNTLLPAMLPLDLARQVMALLNRFSFLMSLCLADAAAALLAGAEHSSLHP